MSLPTVTAPALVRVDPAASVWLYTVSRVPAAAATDPVVVPPPSEYHDPAWTVSVPALANGTPTKVCPPPVLVIDPVLVNEPPPAGEYRERSADTARVPALVNAAPLYNWKCPLDQVAVPRLTRADPSR